MFEKIRNQRANQCETVCVELKGFELKVYAKHSSILLANMECIYVCKLLRKISFDAQMYVIRCIYTYIYMYIHTCVIKHQLQRYLGVGEGSPLT